MKPPETPAEFKADQARRFATAITMGRRAWCASTSAAAA
jgi:hypothetical protein